MSFDQMEWKDLARACRALAYHLEQQAEKQRHTTIHPQAVAEVKRFQDYAERCEREAKALELCTQNAHCG